MNRTYRLVWNEATQRCVPAAEGTRARRKSGGCKLLSRLGTVLLAAALGSNCVGTAEAAPTGGAVATGQGTISQSGATTTVSQQSQNLSLNWVGFSIAPGETVRFVQPSSTSVAVNRVTGSDPSQIYGQLQSNGQVFLINPNGVLFKPGAEVDVGSLVASTLKLTDADFRAGHYQFTAGSTTGTVDNEGHLTAAPGGYLALLGPTVSNNGAMKVTSGTVLLAAGNKVSLQLHNGSLLSYSIDQGALHALAENNQLIQADGGRVYLSAQGANSVSKAVVNNTGIIEARTVDDHNGVIRLLSDATVGQVNVGGTLDASAPHGGNGGVVETSAAQVTVADTAHITTAAPAGKTGTWSVEEADFTVAASGGDISGATLSSELATTGVTIATTRGKASGHGDIVVDDAVSWSANTTLTLNAAHNIQMNSAITATGNTAGLVLNYGFGDNYYINGGEVTLSGNDPSLSIGGHAYTVINSLGVQNDTTRGTLQGIRNDLSGYYALGSDIDASATSGWTAHHGQVGLNPLSTTTKAFTGQFAGLGHVISNLTVNHKNDSDVGLFGVTGADSVIRDVGLNGGTVVGSGYVGSLVGFNQGKIIDSYAAVSVSGQHDLGGLVGENGGTISSSYGTGAVTGLDKITGGLVGMNEGTITNSYATGRVTGYGGMTGGLVGENGGAITDSYAAGKVGGSTRQVGGLVGYNTGSGCDGGTVTNSFWDKTTSGQATSDGGIGMTTAQMQTQANFTSATAANGHVNPAWDFSDVWLMYNGSTYPLLKSFLKPIVVTANDVSAVYTSTAWNGSDTYTCSTGNCVGVLGTVKYGGSAAGAINVGDYSIVPGGLYSNQQGYAITYVAGQLAITPASLTITGISANNKVYDATTAAVLSGTARVLPLGSDSVTLSGTGSGVFSDKNVGTDKAVTVTGYTISGPAAGNYTLIEPVGLTANISPASLALTGVSANNKAYDTTVAATLVGAATVSGLGSDSVAVSGSGRGVFSDRNVGTDKPVTVTGYTLVGTDAGNYTLVEPTDLTANISPANLLISGLTASNKVYDTTVATTLNGTATVTALGTDRVALSGSGSGAFGDKNVGTGKLVTVSGYSLSGADANNYALVEPAGLTADITPAALAITGVTANNKVYDTTVAANLSGTATVAALGSDNVIVMGTGNGTFSDKNVGSNKAVTVSGYSLGGFDAGNYTLIDPVGLTANISPASLALTGVSANNKVYDGTVTASLSGAATVTALGNDSVTVVSIGKGVFSDKNVGTDKTVSVSDYSLSGADAGNYTLIEPTGLTANVAARSLTVSAIASNKVYDGSTDAAVTLGDNRIAGDVLATGYTLAAFTDASAGTGKTVSVSGIALSGVDAGNYTFNTAAATTASITPAPLTVAANNAIKAYDGIAYSGGSGVTYTGFVAGQSAGSLSGTLMYGGTSQGAINVGSYTIIPGGLSSRNYAITFVNGVLTVAPAVLTIAANETSKLIAATAYGDSMAGQATTSSSGTSPYDDSSQGAVNTSTYTLISGGLPSDTNSIGYIDGILTITPDGNEIH